MDVTIHTYEFSIQGDGPDKYTVYWGLRYALRSRDGYVKFHKDDGQTAVDIPTNWERV